MAPFFNRCCFQSTLPVSRLRKSELKVKQKPVRCFYSESQHVDPVLDLSSVFFPSPGLEPFRLPTDPWDLSSGSLAPPSWLNSKASCWRRISSAHQSSRNLSYITARRRLLKPRCSRRHSHKSNYSEHHMMLRSVFFHFR